jgi:hypothetical protein
MSVKPAGIPREDDWIMRRGMTGKQVEVSTVGEKCQAFIPDPLPPHPAIEYDTELRNRMDKTMLALGRLDELISVLPDPALFADRGNTILVVRLTVV